MTDRVRQRILSWPIRPGSEPLYERSDPKPNPHVADPARLPQPNRALQSLAEPCRALQSLAELGRAWYSLAEPCRALAQPSRELAEPGRACHSLAKAWHGQGLLKLGTSGCLCIGLPSQLGGSVGNGALENPTFPTSCGPSRLCRLPQPNRALQSLAELGRVCLVQLGRACHSLAEPATAWPRLGTARVL